MSEQKKTLMQGFKPGEFFRKYTMIIALVAVTIVLAMWPGKRGLILQPANLTGLIAENGCVFVLGDHRSVSKDSRNPEVGLVPEENIIGKVILRISPF